MRKRGWGKRTNGGREGGREGGRAILSFFVVVGGPLDSINHELMNKKRNQKSR